MVYHKIRQGGGPEVRIIIGGSQGESGCGFGRKRWRMGRERVHGRGDGGEFGRRRGHRRGGPRRALDHGHLRLLLLQLIAEEKRHGYDLIREIEARTGAAYVPSPGVIYPALETLLDLGWVTAVSEGSRRSFQISAEGQAELAREGETVSLIQERLDALKTGDAQEDPDDVRGAMRKLRRAVMQAYREGAENTARRRAIADILNEAQEKIAKLSGR